jgi:hypothetical protein
MSIASALHDRSHSETTTISQLNPTHVNIESSAMRLKSAGFSPFKRRQAARREASPPGVSVQELVSAIKLRCESAAARVRELAVESAERVKALNIRWMPIAAGLALVMSVTGAAMVARHVRNAQLKHASPIALNVGNSVVNGSGTDASAPDGSALTTPHPSVLDVSSEKPANATVAGLSPELAADVKQAAPQPPSAEAQPGERIVNMHYVLIQSYLDESTANAARDFLNKSGVACTIEHGIRNWRKSFFQVIGLQGFVHPSGPEYLAYREHIDVLSGQFAPRAHSYKRFQPMAIKWSPSE